MDNNEEPTNNEFNQINQSVYKYFNYPGRVTSEDLARVKTRVLITRHIAEIEDIAIQLSKSARLYKRISLLIKIIVIFLGAFIATKEVANQIIGSSNAVNIIIYAVAGLIIATLTGIEIAFKWENKSDELIKLITSSRTITRKIASELAKIETEIKTKINAEDFARLLDILDTEITNIQTKASSMGINTTKYEDPIISALNKPPKTKNKSQNS